MFYKESAKIFIVQWTYTFCSMASKFEGQKQTEKKNHEGNC